MAYDYDTDILAALWTGGEDMEEPYATILALGATPPAGDGTADETSEFRILSTIEAIRSHMELLADRDEARLFHFCLSTMLEGFGSGGFIYGATSDNELTVVEGNVPNPVFVVGDEIELAEIDGVSGGAVIGVVTATGTDLATIVGDFTTAALTDAAGGAITARATPDGRLRIEQGLGGANTRATGLVVTQGEGANDLLTGRAGIGIQAPASLGLTQAGLNGGIYLPKVIQVANAARDRALRVFQGQIRNPVLV